MPRQVAALVRHGVYDQPRGVPSAHLPHPLTDEGQVLARAAGDELQAMAAEARLSIDPVVDASQLLRAWQTARGLATRLEELGAGPFTVTEHVALAERSVGSVANLTLDEIDRVVERDPRLEVLPRGWKSVSTFRAPFPGAESLLEAGARVAAHVDARMAVLDASDDRMVVFVGHGGAFRHAAVHLGVLRLDEVAGLSMFHCRPVLLERHEDGSWSHFLGEWKIR